MGGEEKDGCGQHDAGGGCDSTDGHGFPSGYGAEIKRGYCHTLYIKNDEARRSFRARLGPYLNLQLSYGTPVIDLIAYFAGSTRA
jgi:hypothetical protein